MKKKVPFRNIYINDTTHIADCTSPWHAKGEAFDPSMIEASVREVAGLADAHFFQLAHGRVPWYQSKVYPMREHMEWWSRHFEVPPEELMARKDMNGYVRDGGDILQDYINACRKYGQAAFLSLRMNDEHHIEWCDKKGHTRGLHSISRFLAENQQYMFGGDLEHWSNRALNWIHPEVRDTLFELISEQLENYDIDGFDMDFMRYPDLFDPQATTFAQRREILGDFIRRVRRELDRTERNGRHRYLSIRLPSSPAHLDRMGFDPAMAAEWGIEMVNVSSSYFTDQWIDFAAYREMLRDVALYFEICHCTTTGMALNANGYDNFRYRRTTENEIYTTAQLAYNHGADGMSYFNFVYYREHGSPGRGPFEEPPFEVIGKVRDRELVMSAPQHFFLAKGWNEKSQLADMLKCGSEYRFEMYIEQAASLWDRDFRFRLMARGELGDRKFTVVWNGAELQPSAKLSEPYPEDERFTPMHGDASNSLAWCLPLSAVKNGKNEFLLRFTAEKDTEDIRIDYMDAFPEPQI